MKDLHPAQVGLPGNPSLTFQVRAMHAVSPLIPR